MSPDRQRQYDLEKAVIDAAREWRAAWHETRGELIRAEGMLSDAVRALDGETE